MAALLVTGDRRRMGVELQYHRGVDFDSEASVTALAGFGRRLGGSRRPDGWCCILPNAHGHPLTVDTLGIHVHKEAHHD